MLKEENNLSSGVANEAFCAEDSDTTSSYPAPVGTLSNNVQKIATTPSLQLNPHEDGGECGWLSFKPKFMQKFRTSKWVLIGLVWAAATQGMVINGFVNVSISTIERRYNLRSASTGLIAGCYDIGSVLCSIPVSYLGSLPGASKPRWLGWGILTMGIGSFVFSLPHFASASYELNRAGGEDATASVLLCLQQTNQSSTCEDVSKEWLSNYKYIFILGQFLHGIGASPLYTLGIAYLDESVPIKMSSFYLGIFHAMAVIGPATGYIVGGQLLNLYIDSPTVDPKLLGIMKDSDRWLGAWWIGFIIAGTMAVLLSSILLAFPAEIPGAKQRASARTGVDGYMGAEAFAHIRQLPGATKVLLMNLPFVFLSLAEAFDAALVAGFATFMPKVIENQFGTSAAFSALVFGCIVVPAGGGGTFIGGWLVKFKKMKCSEILRFCTILSSVNFLLLFAFMVSCPDTSLAGVTVAYDNQAVSLTSPSFEASCNAKCSCQGVNYDPVCGVNKVMYYSPCHAGCNSKMNLSEHQIYSDCACIDTSPLQNGSEPLELKSGNKLLSMPASSVSRQKCPSTCSLFAPFLVMLFIVMFLTFLISIPEVTGTLRCVPDTHRSLALGLQGIKIRVLGTIPGPIIFGVVMDSACTLWQNTCEGTGSCRHYNNAYMSASLAGVSLIFKAMCAVSFFLSWWFYRRQSKETALTTQTTT